MNNARLSREHMGLAAEFVVASELCRRGYYAVVTLGNTPNTDILCSNKAGTKFVHIQVRTFNPTKKTYSVGKKAEKDYADKFFWVLSGIPSPESNDQFVYFIIPSKEMADNIKKSHALWLAGKGNTGRTRNDSDIRIVSIPPNKANTGWDIDKYRNRWDLIDAFLCD